MADCVEHVADEDTIEAYVDNGFIMAEATCENCGEELIAGVSPTEHSFIMWDLK